MMTSDELKQLAAQTEADAETILQKLPAQYKNLVAAIVAKTTARVYSALGEMLEMLTIAQKPPSGKAMKAAQEFARRNQALRRAATNGDWETFARLVGGDDDDGADAGASGA